MIVTYQNGISNEAIVLTRTDTSMRVAFRDQDDPVDFQLIHGTWVSEDCEPVQMQIGSPRAAADVTEEDCICSPDLAARLMALLPTDSEEVIDEPRATKSAGAAAVLLA
jgi:hypothetical protein